MKTYQGSDLDRKIAFNNQYRELYERLANKYGLEVRQINQIRQLVRGEKKTRAEIIFWAKEYSSKPRVINHRFQYKNKKGSWPEDKGRRKQSRKFYLGIIDFIRNCTEEDWKAVIYQYKYGQDPTPDIFFNVN